MPTLLTLLLAAELLTAPPTTDLQIAAALKTPDTVEPGAQIKLEAHLVNHSRTITHRVVRPGDGSEVAWREPYVFYSAEADSGDGVWRPVAKRPGGRCGLYDHDWPKDVLDLKPGERMQIN
ncbi:MAG: hypothetical protein ACI9WU_001457 [Myxococcota bacterium]|jgi:hypothetical protein